MFKSSKKCWYDFIQFGYHVNGELLSTNGQCGCLDENHESCNYHEPYEYQPYQTIEAREYDLIGSDISMGLSTFLPFGGKVAFNWTCRSELDRTKGNFSKLCTELRF